MRAPSRSQVPVAAVLVGLVVLVGVTEWRRAAGLAALHAEIDALKKRVDARDEVEPLKAEPCARPCVVSMVQLIAHPARYDGLQVQFSALYLEGFELSALYPPTTRGALREVEGIWVDDHGEFLPGGGGSMVDVGGTFRYRPSGHLKQYFAELTDVQWVHVIEPAN